jgi:hypothetical protein
VICSIDGLVNKAQKTTYGIPRRLFDPSRNHLTTLPHHALRMVMRLMSPWGLARLKVDPLGTIMSSANLLVKQIEAGFVSGCLGFLGQGLAESRV